VSFSSAGGCSNVAGLFTMTSGSVDCTVKYDQAGNANYNAAPQKTETVNATPASPAFTFNLSSLPAKTYGDPSFSVTGYASKPSDDTGAVTFALGSGSVGCAVTSAGMVTITGAAVGSNHCIISASLAADANYLAAGPVSQQFNITKAMLTITATGPVGILLGASVPTITPSYSGFVYGEGPSNLTTKPTCGTDYTVGSPVGTYNMTCSGASSPNYQFTYVPGTFNVLYVSTGTCLGSPGHAILQPVNADGTSVFKQASTVPAKFRVCDVNGNTIGTPGVVASFRLVQTVSGTVVNTVDEAVDSTTPDSAFRWSSSDQQWIYNISTKSQKANTTYYYDIHLNDGTDILFHYGLK
ncbi:MAG: PxKF domain-containing protein, partial [Gaiellaceae bacterium]